MKGDEFEGPGNGPIPPHERPWRHPAEVAHDSRTAFMRDSAPPPLSRRTTAVVATASLAASAVLLALTLPRGVNDRPETVDAAVSAAAKGTSPDTHLVTVDGRDFGALPVGDGQWITSASAITDDAQIELRSARSGLSLLATVVGSDERLGIAILRAGRSDGRSIDTGNVLRTLPGAMVPEPGMRVVHPHDGSEVNCHPSITLTAAVDDDTAPVSVDEPIVGAAMVTDAWGTPLGIVVDRPSGHLMISGAAIETFIATTTSVVVAGSQATRP